MKKYIISALLLTTSLAHADFLNELNKVLATTGSVLDAATGTSSTQSARTFSANAGHPNATNAQKQAIQMKLINADVKGNASVAMNEARSVLQDFLERVACSDEYGMKNIGEFTTLNAAQNKFYFSGAMKNTQYHPKTSCMSVTQVGNVTMPALNALRMEVMFVSDVSGESDMRAYLLMKQSNGTWLVDKAGGRYPAF